MAVTSDDSPLTAVGTAESVTLLSPSWPVALDPQHIAAPATTAQVWSRPALMLVTPLDREVTTTGTALSLNVSLPSAPVELSPQHIAPPRLVTPHVWFAPALIDTKASGAGMVTGGAVTGGAVAGGAVAGGAVVGGAGVGGWGSGATVTGRSWASATNSSLVMIGSHRPSRHTST
jgi:hypothetical protein